jgi:hypothetical protein
LPANRAAFSQCLRLQNDASKDPWCPDGYVWDTRTHATTSQTETMCFDAVRSAFGW